MKITIESTDRIVTVQSGHAGRANAVPARVWQGTTESGIPVVCCITRVAVPAGHPTEEFERELQEHAPPNEHAVKGIPLSMII